MIVAEDYTLNQLKFLCDELGLPSSGTKATLVKRLNNVPSTDLSERISLMNETFQSDDEEINGTKDNGVISETVTLVACGGGSEVTPALARQQLMQTTMPMIKDGENGNEMEQQHNNDNDNDNQINEKNNNGKNNNNKAKTMEEKEKELLLKEISLLQRERDILMRENSSLNTTTTTKPASETEVPFNTLKELLPSCNGGSEFKIWFSQLKSIRNTYNVSEKNMRALICAKLEGNAKSWIYSKPHYLDVSVDDLMQEMKDMFEVKENRILMRHNFEERKWKYGEKFVDYFNAKIILANSLRLQDDELLEYLVEGISSPQLRTQAKLQNYKSKDEFLQIFKNIEQRQHPTTRRQNEASHNEASHKTTNNNNANAVKCFNCNSSGHVAAECRKPKREVGTCYACGQLGHFAKDCSQYKKTVVKQQSNEYNAY